MMKRFTPIFTALFIAVLASVALAQQPVSTKVNGPELFALEELRPGMKGTARTVFSGTEPEEFGEQQEQVGGDKRKVASGHDGPFALAGMKRGVQTAESAPFRINVRDSWK